MAKDSKTALLVVDMLNRYDHPDAEPLKGDPAQLLGEWQRRLGLRLDEKTGKIEPVR